MDRRGVLDYLFEQPLMHKPGEPKPTPPSERPSQPPQTSKEEEPQPKV